ncbi:hypothetical protein [Acinetobacter puyangensis]|uniref:hypothetical protein n=1 Tax=Acinetobacter puyangensis TaxID=1096779 RepID=UPI003A4E21C9
MSTILVKATKVGFYKGIKEVDQVFPVDEKEFDAKSSWYEKTDGTTAELVSSSVLVQEITQQPAQGGEEKPVNYAKMNKPDLIAAAVDLGITLVGNETNPQIIELIQAALPKKE